MHEEKNDWKFVDIYIHIQNYLTKKKKPAAYNSSFSPQDKAATLTRMWLEWSCCKPSLEVKFFLERL